MKYRLNTFFAAKNYTSNTTEVIDLRMKDVISNIIIKLDTVNVGDTIIEHPIKCINKIELVDGSDVLYSLNGFEAEALDWYDQRGKFRPNWNWCLTTLSVSRQLAINFGRYLWDREFAFDPTKFTNPQLRITVHPAAGGNTPSSVYITCFANMFEESPPGVKGFFMSKEVKQYTMADATHEYTDLPLDWPIRGLYLQPFLRGTESVLCLENVKLSEDQDKRVPYNHSITDIMNAIAERYPEVVETYIMPVSTGGPYLYIAPTNHVFLTGSRWEASSTALSVACTDGDGGKARVYGSASGNAQILVRGDVPHAVFEIAFGLKDEPSDWYDVSGLGSMKLDVTGNAAAEGHIFLQQARSY